MKRSIKILLVEPRNEEILTGSAGTPPLWPCVLAALTPDRHHLEFIQCSFEQITDDELAAHDLVGVSSRTDTASHAYQIGEGTPLGAMLLSMAREEMWHMDWLADEIGEMGAEPDMTPGVYPHDPASNGSLLRSYIEWEDS